MAAKLAFFLLFFLVVVYVVHGHAVDVGNKVETQAKNLTESAQTPADQKTAAEVIDETFTKIKTGLEDFGDKVKNSEFVKKAGEAFESFGEAVQQKGKEALDKIKGVTSK